MSIALSNLTREAEGRQSPVSVLPDSLHFSKSGNALSFNSVHAFWLLRQMPEPAAKQNNRNDREYVFSLKTRFGGEITPEEIRARIGEAGAVYIREGQNKAYWVKDNENGDIDLW